MCNCIENIENKLLDLWKNDKTFKNGNKIQKVTMRNMQHSISFSGGPITSFIGGEVEVDIEGQKKKKVISIEFNYCPFCGEKRK